MLPGLVDLHTHVFHGCTYWGVDPDVLAHDSGVTTWVDAGSAGTLNLEGLHEYIDKRACADSCLCEHLLEIGIIAPEFEL